MKTKNTDPVTYVCETLRILLDPTLSDACTTSYSVRMLVESLLRVMEGIRSEAPHDQISTQLDTLVADLKLICDIAAEQVDAAYQELQTVRNSSIQPPDVESIKAEIETVSEQADELNGKQEELLDQIGKDEAELKNLKRQADRSSFNPQLENLTKLNNERGEALKTLNAQIESLRDKHSSMTKYLRAWEIVQKGI